MWFIDRLKAPVNAAAVQFAVGRAAALLREIEHHATNPEAEGAEAKIATMLRETADKLDRLQHEQEG